jgi:geranylgeranyl diphosphate synthase, type II
MTPQQFLAAKAAITNEALRAYVQTWQDVPQTLYDAIVYSLMAGGKQLRPALCLGAAELVGGDDAVALPTACALEMIHTYSLIHDDLPCMDNDDLRRGKPTSHRVYGEAMAVLAGDGLLTMAFDLLASTENPRVIREVAQAAGVAGMVGGQAMDLLAENTPLSLDDLQRLHAAKTGALIRASVRSGAILAGACDADLAAFTAFGENLGLAFQIADDVLDVIGTESRMGKRAGGDAARAKSTYPALVGLDQAQRLGAGAVVRAIEALEPLGARADIFRDLARYVMSRDR